MQQHKNNKPRDVKSSPVAYVPALFAAVVLWYLHSLEDIKELRCAIMQLFFWISLNYRTLQIVLGLMFFVPSLIYFLFYDLGASPYLSWMYRTDKYGVVINYALLSVTSLAIASYAPLSYRHSFDFELIEVLLAVLIFTLFQIYAVNFIFSQHTTRDNIAQKSAHMFGVCLLILTTLLRAYFLASFNHDELPGFPNDYTMLFLTSGVLFPVCGWARDLQCVRSRASLLKFFTRATLILESVALYSSTLCYLGQPSRQYIANHPCFA